ncbi:MAG TPA: non-homologous end-joining DNA ligase [Kofleriaceae bacterium]|nr:non-homologous end-joining DNA ligase [Kofleriaceae bacterium]
MPPRRSASTAADSPAADSPAEKLGVYRAKRDFGRTPEPSGGEKDAREKSPDQLSFVVQKHDARRLHYDFRLELDGVLLSWAIPKGPSLDPADKRLAVQTEDHPIAYGGFEGVIPEGEYGGGSVIVWDRGVWIPEGDPREALRRGRLSFALEGEKLRGKFHLVRTRGRGRGDKESWLFFASKEGHEAVERTSLTEREPRSVISGRTVEQVAEDRDRIWHSKPVGGSGSGVKARVRALAEKTMAAAAAKKSAAAKGAPGKVSTVKAKKAVKGSTKTPPARAARGSGAAASASGSPAPTGDLAALIAAIPAQLSISVKLTNLDKVLYPEQGLTKAAIVAYYAAVAEHMIPLVRDRPLMLVRCPDGAGRQCFHQKHVGKGTPDALHRVPIEEGGEVHESMALDDLDGLLALAQLGALEVHTWGSRRDDVERPDLLVMDLDPDESLPWDAVRDAAVELRERLADLGLTSFVKTTGGKGLHVVAPFARRIGWDELKSFTQGVAVAMVRDQPKRFVANMSKAQRRGKIFVDYLRNGRGATAVAPYSTRVRAGATVAAPITWDELAAGVRPGDFTVLSMPARLSALKSDPWDGFDELRQSIGASARRSVGPAADKPSTARKPTARKPTARRSPTARKPTAPNRAAHR